MSDSLKSSAAAVVLAALCAGCDKVPLLAPTNSTITLSASSRVLPVNGTTGLTVFVLESGGNPVQNGTAVDFTTTLGAIEPAHAQTTNGVAIATFVAGSSSGIAVVRAMSGGATSSSTGTGTGTGASTSNTGATVEITIGSAAVNTVTLRANPGTVGPAGGSVQLTASVVGETGNALSAIPVTFSADQGLLSPLTATTDSNGEAHTTLTTAQKTSVTATAGTKTSAAVVVDVRAAPGVSITCSPATFAGATAPTNCASLQANASTNSATVVFTVTRVNGSSSLRTVTLDFGDGSSQDLGTLAAGSATVTHTYNGPSGSSAASYTATVRATDVNNEQTSASTTVSINPSAPLTITVAGTIGTPSGGRTQVTFTATVKPDVGGADVAQSFAWDFGDGSTATTSGNVTSHVYTGPGARTVVVKVTTTDGRTATSQTEVNIP